MNLRLKLLLSFSFTAFTALFLFGLVAYDTALEESEKNETRLIFTILDDELLNVADSLRTTNDIETEIKRLEDKNKLFFHITNDLGKSVFTSPEIEKLPGLELASFPLKKSNNNQLEIAHHEYHWKVLEVDNTPYTITAFFHHDPDEEDSFFIQTALSLAITAFIVIWFAAWSAIYIASLLEKLKLQKAELETLATHDSLTGLPNRLLLTDRIEQAILLANRERIRFSLCFIDLNKFKQINDTLGHTYGDQVLQQVAERLKKIMRKSDTVARLGGDELAVILNKTDRQGAELVVEKLISTIETPMLLNGKDYSISASIGIAIYPKHGNRADVLIKNADDAMYIAKKAGQRFQVAEIVQDSTFEPDTDLPDFGPSIAVKPIV